MKQELIDEFNNTVKVLGVTGKMGCGKTYSCRQLMSLAKSIKLNTYYIGIDDVRRDILGTNELYKDLRSKVVELCGNSILKNDGAIDRSMLGEIIFSNIQKMKEFKDIILPYIKRSVQNQINDKNGLVLVEWAMLVEDDFLHIVNDNVLFVTCNESKQMDRLKNSDLSEEQLLKRINCGFSHIDKINSTKASSNYTKIFEFDTTKDPTTNAYRRLLEQIITKL